MYGGYGNIWNQASSQWPSANATSQNQQPAAPSFQAQPQNLLGYGGNLANPNTPGAGMMGYMNVGAAAANPFLNYGANAAGFGLQPAATSTPSWFGNQQFQLHQAFPGGRPPLPPGPPPPDTPKDKSPIGQFSNQNQQTPIATSSGLPFNIANQQRAPPPPPPPPPQSQQAVSQPSSNAITTGGTLTNTNVPGSTLNLEDAYNIIKNAAAYGMLPSCGPLAPLTTLNVSEELFGSKKDSKGIPGLDITEDDKPATPTGPEVVDLEKEPENSQTHPQPTMDALSKSNKTLPDNNSSITYKDASANNTNVRSHKNVDYVSSDSSRPEKNELVWELRPDVKTQEWTRADIHANGSGARLGNSNNNGWRSEEQSDSNASTTMNTRRTDSKSAANDRDLENSGVEAKSANEIQKSNFGGVDSIVDANNRVTIPLESVDGRELVYDRKTLKQFDQKFREWENQFEEWKRSNQSHPNQSSYKQYLQQWNHWREQLIEQRRSILDKMTKAKLDCKEILMAKFEMLDADKMSTESVEKPAGNTHANKPTPTYDKTEARLNESHSENPFEAALRGVDGGRRPLPPKAPLISSLPDIKEENPSKPPPLLAGLGEKATMLYGSNNEKTGRDRPVERILRNSGVNRNDRNVFDSDFDQNQQEKNPFKMRSDNTPFEGKNFSVAETDKKKMDAHFDSSSNSKIPFDWSLPPQKTESNNPFDIPRSSFENPFSQPSGPNPFEIKQENRLPSLDDFIKRTNLNFSASTSGSSKQMESENPFTMRSGNILSGSRNTTTRTEPQFERIPRDPQASTSNPSSNKPMRLEANPVGMPLLIAAKGSSPRRNEPHNEEDEISRLFSRDRGPVNEDANNQNYQIDDDFVENAEVIDYGGGSNSMDSMDFPRGENPDDNNDDGDNDFSLEDSEVIDYSQAIPPHELASVGNFSGTESYGGYSEEFEQGYPPPSYYGPGARGRGRGHQSQPVWGRGQSRGPMPGHMFERGGPQYPPDFPAHRGRGISRGMGRGLYGPPPQQGWFQVDEREPPPHHNILKAHPEDPEVVELSPSPEPNAPPGIKIAPPNPEFERGERRRSRSRERGPRDRSRSRSRERVNRRGREDTERRGDDSPYGSRRERDRERRSSPERRGRFDERDQRRDRDRFRDRGRRGRSKSPTEDRNPVVRNPLFPSASAGMLGVHPASNPPPPRYQTVLIEDILNTPGRSKRPPRLVIFVRGLPGSGKSHIVKLIKEREVEMGGKAPRILSLDNYFITEMEKKEKDPISGVEVKKTVMEYEYDEEREPLYRAQLVRQFKKTLDEGYFSFVIVDCVNEYLRQFEEMATVATQKRFQVYVAEIEESVDVCVKRNIHKRTKEEIMKIHRNWERTPSNYVKLDIRTLLQDEAIQEVEMEDVSDVEADSVEKAPTPAERGKIGPQVVDLEDIEDEDSGDHLLQSSKWDSMGPSQEKLNKLDGLMRRKRASSEEAQVDTAPSIESWLTSNMPEDYVCRRPTQPGQKRVRWADIEEKREQERMREMGFVVGQTDWKRMMDPTGGSSALTKTKFF